MYRVLLVGALVFLMASVAKAQDPVKVDPQHYKVEFENSQVRVLHIHYGPHEKSVMHYHPDGVVTYLTDGDNTKFTLPDGKTIEGSGKAGETRWTPAGKHLPENDSDKAFDAVLVELKSPHKAAPKAEKSGQ
jgi:quercetin dioxygenase-like cupin family protein